MAFPATPLPIRNELFLGGGYVEVTDYTYIRQAISIVRGIPDEAYRADPTAIDFQLNNRDGRFSEYNPAGTYYGEIGRNTPHRCVVQVSQDDFADTRSNGWGTSSWGDTWTTSGGVASDYAVGSGVATVDVDTVNSQRLTILDVNAEDVETYTTLRPGVVATGAAIQMEVLLRIQDTGTFYELAVVFSTGGTYTIVMGRRDSGSFTSIGSASGSSYTASTEVAVRFKAGGHGTLAAKVWDASGDEPVAWTVRDVDSSTPLGAGDVGTRSILQTGNTNTSPVAVTYGGTFDVVNYRGCSEVTSLPPRWDVSGKDVWTPASGAGILRRLGQGGEPPLSAMYRSMSGITANDVQPTAYWPLEDGSDATQFAASDSAVSPATVDLTFSSSATVTPASDDTMGGSLAVPVIDEGGIINFAFPSYTDNDVWAVQMPVKLASSATTFSTTVLMSNGYRIVTTMTGSTSTLAFTVYDASLSVVITGSDTFTSSDIGVWRSLLIQVENPAAPSDVATARLLDEDGTEIALASNTTTTMYATATSGLVTVSTSTDTAAVGHYALFTTSGFDISGSDGAEGAQAMSGWAGEQAHERVTRVCRERGVPLFVLGSESSLMGAQQPGGFLDILDACAVVDMGLLFEARDELALIYRCRKHRYNQAVKLALTYGTSGHVAPPLEPQPDDYQVVNDLEVRRRGGSRGRYPLESGRLSIQAPPDGVGRYDQQYTLDLYTDSQCIGRASFEVLGSTFDAQRFPTIHLDLAAMAQAGATTVYADAQLLDIGDRLTIGSMPVWAPLDVDQQGLGITETIGDGGFGWDIELQCLPTGVWGQVGTYGDGTGSSIARPRYGLSGATLDAAFDPVNDTSFDVDYGDVQIRDKTYSPALQLDVGGYIILATTVGAPTGTVQTVSGLTIPSYATTTKPATTTVRLGPDQRARYGL